MTEKADKQLAEHKEELKEKLKDLDDPKKAQAIYNAKLDQYTVPKINTYVGVILSIIAGLIAPCFGYMVCQNLFKNMEADYRI